MADFAYWARKVISTNATPAVNKKPKGVKKPSCKFPIPGPKKRPANICRRNAIESAKNILVIAITNHRN